MKRKIYTDGNGSEAVLIEGLGHYIPVNQAVALEKEIDQLKAQVEQLREVGNDVYSELQQWALQSSHKETDSVFKAWRKAREATPAQCLAERDYNIAKKAFINGVNYAKKRPDVILHKVIEMVAADYAYGEQLRQSAKDGE